MPMTYVDDVDRELEHIDSIRESMKRLLKQGEEWPPVVRQKIEKAIEAAETGMVLQEAIQKKGWSSLAKASKPGVPWDLCTNSQSS